VHLVGGNLLDWEQISAVADPDFLSRLPEEARAAAVMLDLRRCADAGRLGLLPDLWRDPPGLPDISWDGQALRFARWPNRDWATVTEVLSERPPVIRYTGERPATWDLQSGVWLHGYWFYEWIDETVRVTRIDTDAREIELAVRPPYRGIGDGSRGCLRRFRAINVLEELDEPGEYWIDPEKGVAIVLPPTPAPHARILVATLAEPIVKLAGAEHIELRGFTVESGRGDGITIENGAGNAVVGCEVRNVGDVGIRVSGRDNTVRSCDVHHTGANGLLLDGGDRVRLEHARNAAINCDIHHMGRVKQTYSPGIQLSGCGQIARHNRVHDGPHIGIAFKDNDHRIEYNEIDHVCTDSGDVAAIYSANSPAYRGTHIRNNFVHHIPLNIQFGATGVYLDNALCGNVVEGNVFYRACDSGGKAVTFAAVYVHHGYQNLIANNVFIDCARAAGANVYNDEKWHTYKAGRLKWDSEGAAGLKTDAWMNAYRDKPLPGYGLREFLAWTYPDNCLERLNPVRRNLVVDCVSDFGRYLALADNVVTDDLLLFRDAARGDFTIQNTAALPAGFEPIPFADIGLQRDNIRRALPERIWGNAPPVADAGLNRVVFAQAGEGTVAVALDASASHDPDGTDIRSCLWLRNGREVGRGQHAVAELPAGDHTIVLRVMDYDGFWSTDDIRVAVLDAAREPELRAGASPDCPPGLIALPDHYRTPMDTVLTVPRESGLLANDGEVQRPGRVDVLAGPEKGVLTVEPDGAFLYKPPANWEGVASFTYRIRIADQFSNTVPVEIAVGTTRGFVWDRSEEWTPGTAVGEPTGNPDDDVLGRPVWFYGSTTDRSDTWYAAAPLRHVWDREWCSQTGNSCWVREDDEGPFFRSTVIFQTDSAHFPIVRWQNPTGRALRLHITGEIAVSWRITPKDGTRTRIVIAADTEGEGKTAFDETSPGKPGGRVVLPVDVTVDVAPDGIVILGSRTEDTGDGWVTTTDDLTYTIEHIE
jgi:GNAT superfamily N-acetyltransferase